LKNLKVLLLIFVIILSQCSLSSCNPESVMEPVTSTMAINQNDNKKEDPVAMETVSTIVSQDTTASKPALQPILPAYHHIARVQKIAPFFSGEAVMPNSDFKTISASDYIG
jgi:hypothetical protein